MILKKIKPKYILILILLVAAFLRLYRLDYPKNYVFDEVYHAFTAKEYLTGHKVAWEWWTTPPPGVAYEWTHPPLAKEIMAVSMFILHTEDAWAYRLPGALLGILSIYIVYLLGLKLLKNQWSALISAFVFSIDGLNFVQSRTGMNDIYYVTFVLISLLFFLNKKIFFSSLFFGLALSSKWAAAYLFFFYLILIFKNKNFKQLPFFIFVPILVYLITYIPFFLFGHSFNQFISLQEQMWWYHTNLKATHNYSSAWWSWPLNLYPVWYFVDYQKGLIANIFTSGNPALFWIGSAAIILTIWETIKKRSENLFIIVLGFLIFWLPWSISPRIMFLYHFSPSVPFLCLSLGYQLEVIRKERHIRTAFILLGLITLAFLIIFPFLTGVPIPKNLVNLFFLTNLSKNPFN